jgi:hypothetical protein
MCFARFGLMLAIVAAGIISLAGSAAAEKCADLAELAPGWRGEVVAKVDQSYCGWGVTVGDGDNDGKNEILATGCPDSRLYLFQKAEGAWKTQLLAEHLAKATPGMGLCVKVLDLNGDGRNEVILGTGQDGSGSPAHFYLMQTDGRTITSQVSARALNPGSAYTHNFACHDLNGDGVMEVISAYCGTGEIVRYDIAKDMSHIAVRTIHNDSGSGEDTWIADVDNDGRMEFITANGYREGRGTVDILDFDAHGELVVPPRIVIDGFDGQKCFLGTAVVGDIDNNGKNELIIGWNREHMVNKGTIIAYRVEGKTAESAYTFTKEDPDMGYGYFGQLMCVADVDNDGKNELAVTTRNEPAVVKGHADGGGPGRAFLFSVTSDDQVQRTPLVTFRPEIANSCWPAVGDADNDGKNELVLTTGHGIRTQPGSSHVLVVKKLD